MAERPEDDAPTLPSDGVDTDAASDDPTSADAHPPAVHDDDDEEDEPTVLSKFAEELARRSIHVEEPAPSAGPATAPATTEPARADAPRPLPAVSPPKRQAPPSAGPKPARSPRPAAGVPPVGDDDTGGVETAPRMKPVLPLRLPGTVEIRTVEHDELLDETEVKTVPGDPPAVGKSDDDSETMPRSRAPSTQPRRTNEIPTRPGVEVETSPGVDPPTHPRAPVVRAPNASVDDDESVTARGPAVAKDDDDSVTMDGPAVAKRIIGARLPPEDDTDRTTRKRGRAPVSRDEEDGETLTERAPGVTNMLRVIASEAPNADARAAHDNETEVMAGAPVAPIRKATLVGIPPPALLPAHRAAPGTGARTSAAAVLEDVVSDSGLRIVQPNEPSADRASFSALGVPEGQPVAPPEAEPIPAPPDAARRAPIPPRVVHETDYAAKLPPYGLLVAIVAAISFVVPVLVYLVLRQPAALDEAPRPSVAVSDPVVRAEAPRAKDRSKAAAASSAAASASASAAASAGKRPPTHR